MVKLTKKYKLNSKKKKKSKKHIGSNYIGGMSPSVYTNNYLLNIVIDVIFNP